MDYCSENVEYMHRIWGVGCSFAMPECGNISFWHEDFSGKYYPADTPIFGFRIKDTYSFHHIISGTGYFCTVDKEYKLKEGDTFFIKAGEAIKYYPDQDDPWRYCGICCDGADVGRWLNQNNLTGSCVIGSSESKQIGRLITGVIQEHSENGLNDFILHTELYRILSIFATADSNNADAADYYILAALDYIRENIGDPELRIETVARAAGISHSYLCRIIQNKTGRTVKNHMIRMRLQAAARLLKNTDLNINEIVWSVGFSDPSHFCKAFKNYYKVNPSEFRKLSGLCDVQ